MELSLLQSFQVVINLKSFTLAAERLGRTQAAISMQIKRLEELLGVELVQRKKRGVELTLAGEKLLRHAARMLRQNQEALHQLSGQEAQGSVRLGTPADYANSLLSGALPRFARSFPLVQVRVRCDWSQELRKLLDRGELDLALVTRSPGDKSGELVRRERLVWATAMLNGPEERDPLPLALFPLGCLFRSLALEALQDQGRPHLLAYESPSLSGLQAAVTSGMAVGVLAQGTLLPGMRELDERQGFPALPEVEVALHRGAAAQSPPAVRLAEYIMAGFPGDDSPTALA